MTEILGYTSNELKGKELWHIGLFGDRESSQAAVRELQEQGYIRYDDLPLETKRGEKVDVEFVSNVYQEDGKRVIQCNIRSITEHRQLERTKIQAEALADLHRRKDEFLAMLSHELRNPLAPISNAVQLLSIQPGNETPLQQQARTVIERQVRQLKHLIDDLLEVSRITTGRIRLHTERVDLRGILENAVETVRTLIDQSKHELTVSQASEPIILEADTTRLEQVLVNLLTNAAKYTPKGGHISVSLQRERDEAVFRVRDTGVGIAPDLLPRIFDPFTQSERSLDRSQGGLGIGLTVVQRLVQMHGGRIEVHSSLGHGSEFVVRLPVTLTPAPMPPVFTGIANAAGPSLRVLIVDDNVDAAQTFAMLLQAMGHEVRMAHDGPTSLQAALDFQPNVALLDIGLPGMNGYEVAKQLRQQVVLRNVTLIAITGYGQESDQQRSREAGFDHHLVKPVDSEKLRQALATVKAT
jgi:PAS domain S-box-containing protein